MPARAYRALSLDLWFTTLYFESAHDNGWRQRRAHVLQELVRRPTGDAFPLPEVERAYATFQDRAHAGGRSTMTLDPREHVVGVAEVLGGIVPGSLEEAGRRYSAAGVVEFPPKVNAEATAVADELRRRGVPVIAITNTARRAATWQEHLPAWNGPVFDEIVTSCEVGAAKPDPRLFAEAARRLGLPPSEILHVGDRPELDLAGATAAGFGAVVYRGFWNRYPDEGYGTSRPGELGDDVGYVDRLEELLDPSRFAWLPRPSRPSDRPRGD